MTWEQKLQALQAIGDTSLRMRHPGNWFVNQTRVSIGGDGLLTGAYGNGPTPENAVNDHWLKLVVNLPESMYLVLEEINTRRHVRWNGFMWQEVVSV